MFNTPILFLIFNRPDVTKRVFERIRQIRPARLYVAADGPRTHKAGEQELCDASRNIMNGIDWPCELKTLYRHSNLGCGKAVSEGIGWFFEQEEMGIILEDDILPDVSFFNYCAQLLHVYKNDSSVMHLNGCNFQHGQRRGTGSYYFSAFPHVWGWASWRRAWKNYDFNLSDVNYFHNLDKLGYYFTEKRIKQQWYEIFFRMNRKWMDTWDFQWNYAIWNKRGKVITPNANLVSNIGFGPGATHTLDINDKFANLPVFNLNQLQHPSEQYIHRDADLYTFISNE